MYFDSTAALVFASALALMGALVLWAVQIGALSISRTVAALRVKRARAARRRAFLRPAKRRTPDDGRTSIHPPAPRAR